MTEVILRLTFLSDDASLIRFLEQSFKVIPDFSWRQGDRRNKTNLIETDNGCYFEASGLKTNIEDQCEVLRSKLKKIEKELQLFVAGNKANLCVELSCTVYAEESPEVHFNKSCIKWLGRLHADLDIQVYE